MNYTPGVPSGRPSATRRPEVRPTVRAARRGRRFDPELYQSRPAELVSDPSGDFEPGLPLSLQEIAFGLKLGTWATGTIFRHGRRRLFVGADGYCYSAWGGRVILVAYIGR